MEKKSLLKFYLKKYDLNIKTDMSYNEMWKIYLKAKEQIFLGSYPSSTIMKKIYEIANYCIIDVLYYQKLLVKLSQINDYRKVASIKGADILNVTIL